MYVCSLSACQLRVHCTIRPALHLCSGSSCALFQVCGCLQAPLTAFLLVVMFPLAGLGPRVLSWGAER